MVRSGWRGERNLMSISFLLAIFISCLAYLVARLLSCFFF
ncbi:MAG: hypothetical protein MRERV_5c036 [Mycoplasmataceae bacterium RV_VA103A]|nr:MAG: hypothetical protein MRERV_5c036 [Mycoplasmataceae bacterium RV_VA103A]